MANLNLNTIALVSTLRPAPFKGSPSSDDYNDSQNETLLDLTSVAAFLNNVLIPMFAVLPDNALSGLQGTSIYGDSTDQTTLFYDSVNAIPLTISDSLRQLSALISTITLNNNNLSIQVGQLQQKLSSTNQNNIATTLQNLTNSLNTLVNQQTSTDASITELNATQGLSNFSAITAPTGSCTGYEGQWYFSQDGHISFADPVSHTWIVKV
jgi:hypothetical protein